MHIAVHRAVVAGYKLRETHNGIKRCAYLMAHILQEHRLYTVGGLCLLLGYKQLVVVPLKRLVGLA